MYLSELAERLIAGQRTRKAVGCAFPGGTVAGGTLLAVDFLAAAGSWRASAIRRKR